MNALLTNSDHREYLSVLLGNFAAVDSGQDALVEELCLDSRDARPGSLFFAVPGGLHDGRTHIAEAIAAGTSAVAYDSADWQLERTGATPQIGIANLSRKISAIADVFFQHPSKKLHVVGITGTNGKSSCALMTAQAIESLGRRCGIVGTIGSGFVDHLTPQPLTTPDAISLQRQLARLASSGAEYICLEVSSHSLDQSRVDGVHFDTVAFTNLSQDHLDYHGDMTHYRLAKSKLFTQTDAAHAVLNIDDDFGRSLRGKTRADIEVTYGRRPADVQLVDCIADEQGLNVSINVQNDPIEVRSPLLGRFNGMNLTTVAAILHSLGLSANLIEAALNAVECIPGRLEKVKSLPHQASVYIDYAHTPDGIRQALASLREITHNDLWCVFGCGGDRDRDKRPLMGRIVERHADHIIITDDNPRSEAPAEIVSEIMRDMLRKPLVEHDRRKAIGLAITQAQVGDSILIAGKGHETVQIRADGTHPFSDRRVAEDLLRGLPC